MNNFKKVFKNLLWYFFGGILFLYFGGAFLIFVEGFGFVDEWAFAYGMFYGFGPFEFFIVSFLDSHFVSYIPFWIFFILLGILIFKGLKNKKLWAWIIFFITLQVQIFIFSADILSFIDAFTCDGSIYVCYGDSSALAAFDFRNDNPYATLPLALIIVVLFLTFITFYKKRKNYNANNIIFNVIFWLFNVAYPIFIIFALFLIFTAKHHTAG